VLAYLLGGYLRLWPVLSASFPLNDGGLFQPLSNSDRRAMSWSRAHTADSARFLVLTGKWFGQDAAAEKRTRFGPAGRPDACGDGLLPAVVTRSSCMSGRV
jgi:hypothetical protein